LRMPRKGVHHKEGKGELLDPLMKKPQRAMEVRIASRPSRRKNVEDKISLLPPEREGEGGPAKTRSSAGKKRKGQVQNDFGAKKRRKNHSIYKFQAAPGGGKEKKKLPYSGEDRKKIRERIVLRRKRGADVCSAGENAHLL